MRIAIDARFYGPLGKGLGRYTSELINHLQDNDQKNEYVILLRKENFDQFKPHNPNFEKRLAEFNWYSLQEQIQLPKLIKAARVDLTHYPHFNVPLLAPKPFVVTIHDLIITHFPTRRATTLGPLLYAIKQFGYKKTIRHAINQAAHIITVSHFSAEDIQKSFNTDPGKISVTYESFSKSNLNSGSAKTEWGINKPYFLYVGNAYPHKNIEKLLDTFNCNELKNNFQLVLVGKNDYFYERVQAYAVKLGLYNSNRSSIVFPGYVSDDELNYLYSHAQAYVFPSLYEGFGLPPLEAMAHNCVVTAARATCLPEILEDAALFFDPQDIQDMRQCMLAAANNENLRKVLRANAQKLLPKYSWEKMVKDTLQVYQSVR